MLQTSRQQIADLLREHFLVCCQKYEDASAPETFTYQIDLNAYKTGQYINYIVPSRVDERLQELLAEYNNKRNYGLLLKTENLSNSFIYNLNFEKREQI